MSDSNFGAFVPGFDFLQGLVKNAGAALPGFGQWVAPTLNPQELEKRINELRAVQFWLEQNARMLATTVQALEVQKMTLSTLSAMNVPMADLKQALKTPPMSDFRAAMANGPIAAWAEAAKGAAAAWPGAGAGDSKPAAAPGKATATQSDDAEPDTPSDAPSRAPKGSSSAAGAHTGARASAGHDPKPGAAGVDPMQWWNALTQQFTQIATQAMKDNTLVKQGLDAAGETFRKAAAMPGEMMNQAAKAAQAATTATTKTATSTGSATGGSASARAKKPTASAKAASAAASDTSAASKPAGKPSAKVAKTAKSATSTRPAAKRPTPARRTP